jgi:hypothetical protein
MSGLDGLGWPSDCAECDRLKMLLAGVLYFEGIESPALQAAVRNALGNPSAIQLMEMVRMFKVSNKENKTQCPGIQSGDVGVNPSTRQRQAACL